MCYFFGDEEVYLVVFFESLWCRCYNQLYNYFLIISNFCFFQLLSEDIKEMLDQVS